MVDGASFLLLACFFFKFFNCGQFNLANSLMTTERATQTLMLNTKVNALGSTSADMLRHRETHSKLEAASSEKTAVQDNVKVKPLKAGKAPMGAIYTKSIDATHNLNLQAQRQTECYSQRWETQASNSECERVYSSTFLFLTEANLWFVQLNRILNFKSCDCLSQDVRVIQSIPHHTLRQFFLN